MCAAATKRLTPLCNAAVPDASAVGRRSPGSRCQCSAKGEMDREKRAQLAQPCLAESTPSVIRTRGTCVARYFRPHGRVCEKPGSSEMAPSQRHRGTCCAGPPAARRLHENPHRRSKPSSWLPERSLSVRRLTDDSLMRCGLPVGGHRWPGPDAPDAGARCDPPASVER